MAPDAGFAHSSATLTAMSDRLASEGPAVPRQLLPLIESTLSVCYHDGGITPLPQGTDTGWRTLPFMLMAVSDCVGMVELEDATLRNDGDRLSAICITPGVRHRCSGQPSSSKTSWWCHLSFTIMHGLDLFTLLNPPVDLGEEAAPELRRIASELVITSRRSPQDLGGIAAMRALGYQLLRIIARRARWRETANDDGPGVHDLLPLFPFLECNLDRRIPVAEMARRCRLSPSRFHDVFRQCTGLSPHAYIQQRQLSTAQRLLLTTTRSIADIGNAVGQSDPFHFSRLFKKKNGMSPMQYRRQIRRHVSG